MGKGFSVAVYHDFLFSPLSSCRHFPHLQDALNARTKAVMLTGWLPEVGKGRWSRKCSEVRPNLATLWTTHTCHQVWKVQQRLYFLRKLKHAHLSHHLLTNFYRSAIESAAARCGSPAARHRTGRTCSGWWGRVIRTTLPSLIYTGRLQKKASCVVKDATHPGHHLFSPCPLQSNQRQTDWRTVSSHRQWNAKTRHLVYAHESNFFVHIHDEIDLACTHSRVQLQHTNLTTLPNINTASMQSTLINWLMTTN